MTHVRTDDAHGGRAAHRWAWALVAARPIAFLAAQATIAGILALGGTAEPWWASAAWWPLAATVANVAGLLLLRARATAEGVPLGRLLRDGRGPRDTAGFALALPLVAVAALAAPWAWGVAVWGDVGVGLDVLASPLPTWAAIATLLAYPLSMAVVDLPTYAYARARARGGALATLGIGLALGLQHAALPFLPAWTFVQWRALMWVPYGLVVVGLLAWRPRWVLRLALVHGLVHAGAAVLVWIAST